MSLLNYLKIHRRKIRWIYWLTVIVVMFFIVFPMFFFFYRFDEDQVRQIIIDQFDGKNYHVAISGQIKPKLWHGLSVEIENIAIATKSDAPLVNIRTTSCQLSWFDLAWGHYKIKRLSLNGVDINGNNALSYGISNLLNFSNTHSSSFNHLRMINIYNIHTTGKNLAYNISDGTIKVRQQGGGAIFTVGLKLLPQNTYIMADGGFSLSNNDTLKFNEFNLKLYNNDTRLDLVADTNYNIPNKQLILNSIVGRVVLDNYSGKVSADNLLLSFTGAHAKNGHVNLNFNNDFANQSLNLGFDNLTAKNYKSLLINQLKMQYGANIDNNQLSVNSTLNQLAVDEKANVISNNCLSNLNFTSPKLVKGGVNAGFSGTCDYFAHKKMLSFNLLGNLNDTPIKLNMQVLNLNHKPSVTAVSSIESLDLSSFEVKQDKAIPLYYDTDKLPLAWLSWLNLNANLTVKHVAVSRVNIDNLVSQFYVTNNTLNITKMTGDIYNGVLSGSAQVTKNGDNYNIKTQGIIRNLDIQSMFNDLFDVQAISGKANLTTNIFANNVSSYDDLHKGINGQVAIDANHGAFQGIDFNLFVNPNNLNLTDSKSTIFERLNAGFNFINGVSKNSSLTFSSPYVIANGGGILDFVNTKIDYNLSIKSALPQNEQKISLVVIPVSINGDLFSPKINIQNIHLVMGDSTLKPPKKVAKGSAKRGVKNNHMKKVNGLDLY